ncbi:MAG: Holliday junction branch migration protein RuvA [Gemmatimonadetes bacterium]|nr:Holliday junction branch migration protein RuvA [Gemmatimonadota bacterium]
MIAAVRGTVSARVGDLVTIATAGGVSYEVAVPISVLERLPPAGGEVHLHTVPIVREDGWSLFGFDTLETRTVFQRLLGASGVGPRLALSLISALGSERVVRAIKEGDLAALCTVSGVGKKKAERMILELKDRMRDLEVAGEGDSMDSTGDRAIKALVKLGYGQLEADGAVRSVLASNGTTDTAEVLREALELLSGGK